MIGHVQRPPTFRLVVRAPTTQEAAIVMGSGGDPFAEYEQARDLCARAGRTVSIFAGNDMIEKFPHDIDHAVTLHPDKLQLWLPRRRAAGFNVPAKVWAHRAYEGSVTDWTRDWAGSTGLFCIKIARELGFVHIIGCGIPMTKEANHFLRNEPWSHANGFLRGWNAHLGELRPYVRSYSGWTKEKLGEPTEQWLRETIVDQHSNLSQEGLRA